MYSILRQPHQLSHSNAEWNSVIVYKWLRVVLIYRGSVSTPILQKSFSWTDPPTIGAFSHLKIQIEIFSLKKWLRKPKTYRVSSLENKTRYA